MTLKVEDLGFYYDKSQWILRHLNFELKPKDVIGLVAPSGYGKSTLAKLLAGYRKPQEGHILFDDKPLRTTGYCPVQLIYQHPEKAVDPNWTMVNILTECWTPDQEVLTELKIEQSWYTRHPDELSGGELQRFCIARVLGPKTKFLIADEITTMFDAITQAQIWNMLLRMVNKKALGILVITHDMQLAKRICTKIINLETINAR